MKRGGGVAVDAAAGQFVREKARDAARKVCRKGKGDVEAEGLGGPLGWHMGVVGGAKPWWGSAVGLG